ncbi:MAG: methylmalonyl Co-A mutase-associated GTPase MeaB [Gemmatimonadetes bacterium]|nr:methylmalonyl Co-A mutase-associated GTPase MeaB [Gemmatimonadota bacterium]
MTDIRPLLDRFRAGQRAALARALSMAEDRRAGTDELLAALHPATGRARRIGLTGPPGAGKSTITTRLARHYREAGLRVGIVAVDPTSPFTGGALLGDRVRMESVALDEGVFIRSMATRGSLGGLAATTRELCDVFDAFGMDRILVETVGVGQSELEIARTADQSVVVLVPESGDSIQAMKAGLMEIADVFVVNKADRTGADRVKHDIEAMLGLRAGLAAHAEPAHHGVDLKRIGNPSRAARKATAEALETGGPWVPPVLLTTGTTGDGLDALAGAVDRHFAYLETHGGLRERRLARVRQRVVDVVEDRVRRRLWLDGATNAWLDAQVEPIATGATTPFAVADALLARSGDLITGKRA